MEGSQGPLRTGSQRARRMERQVRGRGGVDIWRSDCVLTSADADRFGREVPWQRGRPSRSRLLEAYRVFSHL